jgi:RNA polymerase sigma-54 factor
MSGTSQKLDLRHAQGLVMTPQLQQAIRLLQMSNAELSTYLEEEIAANPLLEKAGSESEETGTEDGGADGASEASGAPFSEGGDVESDFAQVWDNSSSSPAPGDFDPGQLAVGRGGSLSFEGGEEGFETGLTRPRTLREHLLEQLHMDASDTRDRLLGAMLIDLLDESGYLRIDRAELAARLDCPIERLGALLDRMKTFDPPGVFARDLAECLSLQLADQGKLDGPMKLLVANLDRLGARDFKGLCALCGVNETYLKDMVAEVKALDPKPAAAFEHFVVQTVVPDVLMKTLPKHLGGGWRVELNAQTLPRVLVNRDYYTDVAGRATARSDRAYLETQMASANWIVRALDQRAQTILKVAGEIVEEQNAFFLYGIECLAPLTLREVAEKTGVHESTVSRVTAGKYIGTPRGIFELKYFFTTAIAGADGASHSAESVRARIRALVEAEAPDAVLSDDSIVEILKKEGVDIARRTVAKYRESLKIPSSVQRRRAKNG